jgi:hypothetical protein
MSNDVDKELRSYRKNHLLELMQDVSEEAYCAGWLDRLEFMLWEMVTGTYKHEGFGFLSVSRLANEIAEMKRLSALVDGWWIWDDGNKFVSLAEWLPRFERGRHAR